MAGRLSAQVGVLAGGVAFLALTGAGCDTVHEIDWTGRPVGLEVTVRPVSGGGLGTPSSPLEMPAGTQGAAGIDVRVDVAVQTADGRDTFDEDLWVRLSARPGRVVVAPGDDRHGDFVLLRGGRATDIPVTLQGVFGETRIWAEDTGFLPRRTAGRLSLCGNGVDDDGDGLTDAPLDPGCEDGSDDSEEGGSGAAGVGNPVWVANPTLAQVQGYGTATPYQGEVVTVDSGDMVVTRVTFSGMYVTDIADTSGRGYNHMFVYNFNPPTSVPVCVIDELDTLGCRGEPPVRVRVCDRVSRLAGIMSEFYKFTEMNFPSWDLTLWFPDQGPCAVPEPKVLSASDVSGNLEPFEAGLVRVTNVTPGRAEDIVDCDLDGNGEVDFLDYGTGACSPECECREACDADPLCTEINQYRQYGQWPVRLGDAVNGLKLWVATSESIPDFDPFDPAWPQQWAAITGTLKNLSFLRPRGWILEPRCMDDIVVSGPPLSSSEACVDPRTGEE
jgi:hypothetical protein